MSTKTNRREIRQRIHKRIRSKISGSAERPRLAVFFSNCHVYAQAIDDSKGQTIVSASTREKDIGGTRNIASASKVGQVIAERLKEKGVSTIVFDRAGFIYHGKVKALADAAREKGLKF